MTGYIRVPETIATMLTKKQDASVEPKFFQSATTFFKITGLWRIDSQPKWLEPYVYFSRFNVFFFFGWAFTISAVSGCYLYYLNGEMEKAMDWGTFSLAYAIIQYKFVLLATNEMRIRNIIKKLEMYSSWYSDKTNVRKSLQASERLTVIGSLLVGGACSVYCIYPVVMNYQKALPVKTMFTFGWNVYESPIYECYAVYLTLGPVCHTVIAMAYDMTYVGILLTSASILKNLNTEMNENVIQTNVSTVEKHRVLLKYIKEHIEIFDFLNDVRELYVSSNMLHFFYNYFTAGLTMLQVSTQPVGSVKFFSMMSGCTSGAFGVITYCEAGQKVSNEMRKFWQNLYFTDWYRQPVKFRKTIAFALHATQKDYYLVAGKMMTLSRETEKNILQAIFTYYTFLHRLNA